MTANGRNVTKTRADGVVSCQNMSGNSIQQQEGSTDCGVFSVAAAHHCAMGKDFGEVAFEQNDMLRHIIECFERMQLSASP